MDANTRDKCEICGEMLEYSTATDEHEDLSCYFCKVSFSANIFCPNGHYICDECHSKDPIKIIEEVTNTTELKNPFHIADIIMEHPKFKVYGPEHHVLVPTVMLTSLKNNNVKKASGTEITSSDIREAIRRASKVPGGWCGFCGSCGAGIGSGICISIFTDATPARDKPRSIANKMTSRTLDNIADYLEHCCKRSVRIALMEMLKFLNEEFDINLLYQPKKCNFSRRNDKCEKNKCIFF